MMRFNVIAGTELKTRFDLQILFNFYFVFLNFSEIVELLKII